MPTYRITICGCDDDTEFDLDMSLSEAAVISRLADKSVEQSSGGCQPTVKIERHRIE